MSSVRPRTGTAGSGGRCQDRGTGGRRRTLRSPEGLRKNLTRAPGHRLEELTVGRAEPDQVVAAVLGGAEHNIDLGRRDKVERPLQESQGERRRVAVDCQRTPVACFQESAQAVREPVTEILTTLRDEREARGDFLEKVSC